MLVSVLKLSRKLLILAAFSGCLIFTLGTSSPVSQAGEKCCWECDGIAPGCENICNFNPNSPVCIWCTAQISECFETCNPDPLCAH